MGGLLSTPSTNPSKTQSQHATMSSKEAQQVSEPPMDDPKTLEDLESTNKAREEQEEEEEGECGFCVFMKGGGCKDSFTAWENCIEDAEKNKEDIVEKCFEVTGALKKCMEAHSDYYAPILQAEKAAEAEAVRELEKEKARESGSSSSSSSSSDSEERLSMKGSEQDSSKGSEKNEGLDLGEK